MYKIGITFIFFISIVFSTSGQISNDEIIQIKKELQLASNDSIKLELINTLASGYRFSNIDSSNFYTDKALKLASKFNLPGMKSNLIGLKSSNALESGDLPEAFQFAFEALKLAEKIKNNANLKGYALNRIGNIYMELSNYRKAIEYYNLSIENLLIVNAAESGIILNGLSNIGNVYELMGVKDSAIHYQQKVYDVTTKMKDRLGVVRGEMMFRMGNAYKLNGNSEKALEFYKKGIEESKIDNDLRNLAMNNLFMAKLYHEMKLPDSTMTYAVNAVQIAEPIYFKKALYDASLLISDVYKEKNDFENAFKYLTLANGHRDALTGTNKIQDLQRIVLDEQERLQKENELKIAEKNKNRQLVLLASLAVLLLIAFIFYRNNRQKQKANKVLKGTLEDLKSTQSQLIQSEKMASLGELTAGIAHEIQNPLNFVNNFSEVSNELIQEIQEERVKKNEERDEVLVGDILNDIKQNLEKINHHGKRADAIVKGMLQHSRTNSAEKEPTDINKLADEYLRLAYHGLRAKDKSFNATLETDFDDSIGKIAVIPQDIGRVILNLITNAFYVVNEKKVELNKNLSGLEDLKGLVNYEPKVTVSTKQSKDSITISVKDNGNGIPQKVLDKIFQPFFTTKPTGQGTGLGLSMSYDIVKAHGGELNVETEVEKGTTFSIELPKNKII
jgi:two-component system NtrC family sensor kinase